MAATKPFVVFFHVCFGRLLHDQAVSGIWIMPEAISDRKSKNSKTTIYSGSFALGLGLL